MALPNPSRKPEMNASPDCFGKRGILALRSLSSLQAGRFARSVPAAAFVSRLPRPLVSMRAPATGDVLPLAGGKRNLARGAFRPLRVFTDLALQQKVRVVTVVLAINHPSVSLSPDKKNLVAANDRHGLVVIDG